jgi:hypothetical protein
MNNLSKLNFGMLIPVNINKNENERYDFGLFLNGDNPMIVFIEVKSKFESGLERKTNTSQQSTTTSLYQYFDICKLQDEAKNSKYEIKEDSYSKSFIDGNWIYIYMTTNEEKSQYYSRNDFVDKIEKKNTAL